jgi:hypothetical protein
MSDARHPTPSVPAATMRWHPLAVVPLALTTWVYYPITRVFFFADDFFHLSHIASDRVLTFVLTPFGGHNLLVRNLVFVGSWHLFGLHSELWYATVLLTHLLNVWLLFGVLGALTTSVPLACLGATIWGMCPLASGTLAWYSVYGHVMAATVLLLVLNRLARLGATGAPVPVRTAWLWYALLLAGTTCFGVGLGVAMVFPLVLFLLLPEAWHQRWVRLAYLALPVVTLATYFGLRRLSALLEPLPLDDLFHQVAATTGLRAAPAMLPPLLGVAVAGSTLGHFFDPQRYPDARAWGSIAAFVVGLGLIAWRGDWKSRRAALAMVALAVGIYGVIALGRANIYVMFKASLAQAASTPRYHYVGSIPIVVLLCQMLQQVGRTRWLSAVPRRLALAAGLGLLVAGHARSNFQIDEHAAARAYLARTAQEIADAVAAVPPGTTVYLENGSTPGGAVGPWLNQWFPGRAGVFLLLSPSGDMLDGRHVRFVERDPKVVEFWGERPSARLEGLLVAPQRAGG